MGSEIGQVEVEKPSQRGAVIVPRRVDGRFAAGNPGGPNPYAKQLASWRAALATVTKDQLVNVVQKLVVAAEAGEPWAVKELLDRCLGKPKETHAHELVNPQKLYGQDCPVERV